MNWEHFYGEVILMMVILSSISISTGYKLVRQFSHPAKTGNQILLPPRLSAISFFLSRLLCVLKLAFRHACSCILPKFSTGSRITRTVSAGSLFSLTVVLEESKETRPRGHKPFSMLNSSEHEIFLLIMVEMPTVVGL